MHPPILIACPACALSSPVFFAASFFIGGVLVGYWFLKPFASRVSVLWGWPRLTVGRLLSLVLMLPGPFLMYLIGRQSHDVPHAAACTGGLILCTLYLWHRSCWLLQQLNVTSVFRQVLFPGVLVPGLLIVGFIVGQGVVAVLLIGPAWPEFAVYFLGQCALVAAPLGLLVFGGLQYVFAEVDAADSRRDIPSSTDSPLGSNA